MYTKHAAATAEETMDLGQRLGERLKPGDVVGLYGGLGAGKTVFVKGIALASVFLRRSPVPRSR